MPDPINLTQLRAHTMEHFNPDRGIYFNDDMAHAVLALIDTAEAAIVLSKHLVMIGGGIKTEQAYNRLRETLNRYATS